MAHAAAELPELQNCASAFSDWLRRVLTDVALKDRAALQGPRFKAPTPLRFMTAMPALSAATMPGRRPAAFANAVWSR